MAVATEKIIPGVLPPKEETEGVDFLGIYDRFDASTLTEEQLLKFAPRHPWMTTFSNTISSIKVWSLCKRMLSNSQIN